MARSSSKSAKTRRGLIGRLRAWLRAQVWRVLRWFGWAVSGLAVVLCAWVAVYRFIDPPGGPYIWAESLRLNGGVTRQWVPMAQIAPVMARSVVAAEDANFCRHSGFDLGAIRAALAEGADRGASTITQQVVKNVFLWQGRSWPRKLLEAFLTPVVEVLWPKRRILEVYLNIAEFDEGIFGVQAGAQRYFARDAADLGPRQSAALAAVLPSPRARDAAHLTQALTARAQAIADGAATILRDGRADCFNG
ncbi:MAG: monofunctional biosynthetic peptidoglycan transglycosylase [Paracoccaceae bacterium]